MINHPIRVVLVLLAVIMIFGLGHAWGISQGYDLGYDDALTFQGLHGITTVFSQIEHLEASRTNSLKYALDVELDGAIMNAFATTWDPPNWYLKKLSGYQDYRNKRVYESSLQTVATYRFEHPTKILNGEGRVEDALFQYLPEK